MLMTDRIVETLGGRRALKSRLRTAEALHRRLREGLPFASVEAVASRYSLTREDLTRLLSLPARTLARRKAERRLRVDESDRLFRLSRIAALAEEMLGSQAKAVDWLHRSNRALGDVRPLDLLDTDLGARQVETVLLRIAHGVYS